MVRQAHHPERSRGTVPYTSPTRKNSGWVDDFRTAVSIYPVALRYCQMLWMEFFLAQQMNRFAAYFDLFISPTSKAR
jgi:hypothetical protein